MLCAWGQILLQRKYFRGMFQIWNREWGVATPLHSLQTPLVWGWCLRGLEVGEESSGRLWRSSVWTWKVDPSVVHWDMKSVHSPLSGRMSSFGYLFSQANILISHHCLGARVNHRSTSKEWSSGASKTQSLTHHLLTHALHSNSHSTPHHWHSYITYVHRLVSLAVQNTHSLFLL